MRILVTGAGGFIGLALVRRLMDAGHEVTALVGPTDAAEPQASRVFRGDVRDPGAVGGPMRDAEVLVHAAGPASVQASLSDPSLFAQVHVLGGAVVFRSALSAGIQAAILVSSAEVYGRNGVSPVAETAPLDPASPYGAAKLAAEQLARALFAGRPLTVIRPFSVYGPGMRRDTVLGTIIGQIRAKAPVRLRALGPVRDYLHVEDLAAMVELAVLRPHMSGARVLNACSGRGVSVEQLARLALTAAGRADAPSAEPGPGRPNDVVQLVGDNRRARRALGWGPRIDLERGLADQLRDCSGPGA